MLNTNADLSVSDPIPLQPFLKSNDPLPDSESDPLRDQLGRYADAVEGKIGPVDSEIVDLETRLQNLKLARKRLEEQRFAAGSVVAPIRRLPPEILSRIFEWYLSDYCFIFGTMRQRLVRLLLTCRLWKNVAMSTPSLWRKLFINGNYRYEDIVAWLRRGGDHLLSLFAFGRGVPVFERYGTRLFVEGGFRWGCLDFEMDDSKFYDILYPAICEPEESPWKDVKTLGLTLVYRGTQRSSLSHLPPFDLILPQLSNLTVNIPRDAPPSLLSHSKVSILSLRIQYASIHGLLSTLRGLPSLTTLLLSIENTVAADEGDFPIETPIIIPAATSLSIAYATWPLRFIRVPALQVLNMSMLFPNANSRSDIVSLVSASGCQPRKVEVLHEKTRIEPNNPFLAPMFAAMDTQLVEELFVPNLSFFGSLPTRGRGDHNAARSCWFPRLRNVLAEELLYSDDDLPAVVDYFERRRLEFEASGQTNGGFFVQVKVINGKNLRDVESARAVFAEVGVYCDVLDVRRGSDS